MRIGEKGTNRVEVIIQMAIQIATGTALLRGRQKRSIFPADSRYLLNIALIVVIDADKGTVGGRMRQLKEALQEANQDPRQPDEQIAIFVPKRNIETWIYWLMGQEVNEDDKYPHFDKEGDCKPYVDRLATQLCPDLPAEAPPSLHAACDEVRRVVP